MRAFARFALVMLVLGSVGGRSEAAASSESSGIVWEAWLDALFERARNENRFVLLDLEAVWCHWCHVMDQTTYRDPEVIALIRRRYIAVKVDQDARPDLANRYEEYGWPATIVFDPQGGEIIKRSGYIPPRQMASVLQAIIDDPTPGPSVVPQPVLEYARESSLSSALRDQLEKAHIEHYDFERGGWGFIHKFLDPGGVELALLRARGGDRQAERMARQTLAAQLALIDPVWGGVYQYSAGGDWQAPHFEKIMAMQAENLRIYSLAYATWGEPTHLEAAERMRAYLEAFLTDGEGAFYASQDADLVPGQPSAEYFLLDDAARRRRGVPKIDRHVYARENGWAIQALVQFCAATGREAALRQALRAARWIVAHRGLPGGGFRHDQRDAAGPYLGDTLAMGRAFLALYSATAERHWLERKRLAARFIEQHFGFGSEAAGLATAAAGSGVLTAPAPQRDENIAAARFANLLFHHSGDRRDRELAERAMRYLATPEVARRRPTAGVLLADMELSSSPTHVTIVGSKQDAQAKALFAAALAYPSSYLRVDFWDPSEPPPPHTEVEYPRLSRAAAFACSRQRCSLPAFEPDQIRARIDALMGAAAGAGSEG